MGQFPRSKAAGGADHPPKINMGRATPIPLLCAYLACKGTAFILRTLPVGIRVLFVKRVLEEGSLWYGGCVKCKGAGDEGVKLERR
jgi:hypothetical protein